MANVRGSRRSLRSLLAMTMSLARNKPSHGQERAPCARPEPRTAAQQRVTARLHSSSKIATTRDQPAEAPLIFTGKQEISKPNGGKASRLLSFSICQ